MQEDRPDFEGLFHVAVAAFDDLLVFVEPQHVSGAQAAGEVGRERVDPIERGGVVDRLLVALPGERKRVGLLRGDGDVDQPGDVRSDDLSDATFDLLPGFVVAAAESVVHPGERVLGLLKRPLAGRGDLRRFF